jgi:predicted dehydrogenase
LAGWLTADFLTDYAELLARKDVDAVVLLTPMREHAPMAKAALQAGKHVLVEKPIATNLDDAVNCWQSRRNANAF